MSNSIRIKDNPTSQHSPNGGSKQLCGNRTGANIRRIRVERGLSAKEFAARIGTSGAQVTRLEKGQRRLTDVWLNRIAKGLDVAVNDLLNESLLESFVSVTYVAGQDEVPKFKRKRLKLPEDVRFVNVQRYGVLIGEDYDGNMFAQGSVVICAPLAERNGSMVVGAMYHVRSQTDEVFRSLICELNQDPSGKLWLVPTTNNPSLKAPILYKESSGIVSIAGLVIGAYIRI